MSVYPTALKTARNKSIIPFGLTLKVKPLFNTTIKIPANDMIIPDIFNSDNFSLKKRNAPIGTKSGIVPMITAARVELIIVSPRLSPIKYRHGSKIARRIIHLMSLRSIFCNCFIKNAPVKRMTHEIISLRKTIENGGNTSLAILNHINVILQKIIARTTLI